MRGKKKHLISEEIRCFLVAGGDLNSRPPGYEVGKGYFIGAFETLNRQMTNDIGRSMREAWCRWVKF